MLIQVKSAAEMEQEKEQPAAQAQQVDNNDQLAGMVRNDWDVFKAHRQPYTRRMQACLRARNGEYSPEKLAKIKTGGGSEVFIKLTGSKCRAAKDWLADLFNPSGDRPYTFEPANDPDMPPDVARKMIATAYQVMQQSQMNEDQAGELLRAHRDRFLDELRKVAEERADKMAARAEDLFNEAGWRKEFDEFLDDITTYPVAIMKGLEIKVEKFLSWAQGQDGKWQPTEEKVFARKFRRVSPFRFYPSPSVTNTLKGHSCIEHATYSRAEVSGMRGMPGYNKGNVEKALLQYSTGGLKEYLWTQDELDLLHPSIQRRDAGTFDALVWSGSISGAKLMLYGVEGVDPMEEYQAEIEVLGAYTIRAQITADPAGEPDYNFASWQNVPGSFYGIALPEQMDDCQSECNAAARALVDNLAYASGPMVWVNNALLAAGQNLQMHPRKVFIADAENLGSGMRGIEFFQPQSNSSELLAVIERFSNLADEVTGLPKFAYGSDKGAGAAGTASGLSMLMNASSKSIKGVVRNIDINMIEPQAMKVYNHIMLYDPDESIKGDLRAKARGSDGLVHKEQMLMRQQELMDRTNNQVDLSIIGEEGRLEQLREVFKSSGLPVDRIIPDKETLNQRRKQEAQQQMLQQQQEQ